MVEPYRPIDDVTDEPGLLPDLARDIIEDTSEVAAGASVGKVDPQLGFCGISEVASSFLERFDIVKEYLLSIVVSFLLV